MMSGVGDRDPAAGERGDLARVAEGPARFALGLQPAERPGGELVLGATFGERGRDDGVELLGVWLASGTPNGAPVDVEDRDRRPAGDAPRVPDLHLGVDGDRVLELVVAQEIAEPLDALLFVELGRVDADDDHRLRLEIGLDPLQRRKRLHAVDAAARPEVDHDDAPGELAERERVIDVEPSRRAREPRHRDPLLGAGGRSILWTPPPSFAGPGRDHRHRLHQMPIHRRLRRTCAEAQNHAHKS